MTETELPDDIKAMSFEQALEELRGIVDGLERGDGCLLYTSPSPRDKRQSRMPSSA